MVAHLQVRQSATAAVDRRYLAVAEIAAHGAHGDRPLRHLSDAAAAERLVQNATEHARGPRVHI